MVSSVFFATLQQLRHRGLRVTGHPCADALQKAVVADLPASDGLIIGVPGRFRDTGQQRLYERIDECKKSLLGELDAPDLAGQSVETCGQAIFGRIDSALAACQFAFDCRSDERARIREAAVLRCPFDPANKRIIDPKSPPYSLCLSLALHNTYAVAGDWRDSAVRECAPVGKIRARRNRPETKRLGQEAIKNVRQPFMFHYPSVLAVWSLLAASQPKRTGKQLKHSETDAAQAALLKHFETLR